MRRIAILVLCLALILPSAALALVANNARDYIPAPPWNSCNIDLLPTCQRPGCRLPGTGK